MTGPQDWTSFLEDAALRAWGAERTHALRPALLRMAEALDRVSAYVPGHDTVPVNIDAARPVDRTDG